MKDKKLIPLSDFVLKQKETPTIGNIQIDWYDEEISKLWLIRSYTKFLKQSLKLGMLIPTDEDGNVLKNPHARDEDAGTEKEFLQTQFNNALKNVLFEGFEIQYKAEDCSFIRHNSGELFVFFPKDNLKIEDILSRRYEITLTPSALKAIGINE